MRILSSLKKSCRQGGVGKSLTANLSLANYDINLFLSSKRSQTYCNEGSDADIVTLSQSTNILICNKLYRFCCRKTHVVVQDADISYKSVKIFAGYCIIVIFVGVACYYISN